MTVLSIPSRTVAPVATRKRVRVRPAAEPSRMTRYRGGTYSHTVDKIVFTDGTTARTDLIRLNPNLQAYSLDFAGIAPHHPSPYELGTWTALPHLRTRGCEAEVEWILRHSYPMRSTVALSRRLRQAGYPLGPSNISEHEAIAGTQAAIWHFTNGLALDTRPLNAPIAVHRGRGVLTFEFDGAPQLGGYALWSSVAAPFGVRLQKSPDGVSWQDVSGSHLTVDAGKGRYQRTLGLGSTLSSSSHGRGTRGYRYYRLVTTTPDAAPAIDHVDFWLNGAGHYRNADRIVHLYNYLLAGAYTALRTTREPLLDSAAVVDSDLVGPFQVSVPLTLRPTGDQLVVDADGAAITEPVEPGTDFYLRFTPGSSGITLTATTSQLLSGRVVTGVALAASHRLTPVALTTPTRVTIEFDITWDADRPCPDVVGECG
ncbi:MULTISPECIES: thioester domain-containing protein [Mycobacterium]|uniref:TQXA domain-containing protein n=1 Tax=Mycobacterium gordonae TaxID=1778 RepID=A0A1A6B6U8_MYCGO|nr:MULTISPECIES: thioester domain-containing protein [Mycobacterium]MCQ4362153.1 thioester domain-containing protein [Mycobacterium gordonae]MCV7009356.1 TQXA domain-containing protein [Mycobacterium gordonae]OBR98005.1 TQXA domain-containing protein [Mycobacterium gordonae]ODR17930.1 TQXA domain-containing protein [Mycobacterium gordonae]ORV96513.1 TQXA domain-containing protein [Mycobacterium gordonae]